MERAHPTVLDLDEAETEIRQRWFVWTAAGLTVHPLTWTHHNDDAEPATSRSLRLHVSRPGAHVDITLPRHGTAEVVVLRPNAEAPVHETAELESVAAFGELLDRVVELITWNGVPKDRGAPARNVAAEHTIQWVVGYDGNPWSGS